MFIYDFTFVAFMMIVSTHLVKIKEMVDSNLKFVKLKRKQWLKK